MAQGKSMLEHAKERCGLRTELIHAAAKRIWKEHANSPLSMQEKCLQSWDSLASEVGSRILPVVGVKGSEPVTNLIFGSGSFSTGKFQVQQYKRVGQYFPGGPVKLQGLVTNKSKEHGCNGSAVASEYGIPIIELDFIDWYRSEIEPKEENPVAASRYWFTKNDPNRPDDAEIERRFDIRQNRFHADLGEKIGNVVGSRTDIVSARGYNYQFCRNMFKHQDSSKPHVNDTHPADLTYVNPDSLEKCYPGWQSGAVQRMVRDGHQRFRGSLIEVDFMDTTSQIHDLDEGSLLAIGEGVPAQNDGEPDAKLIQDAMKLVDDYTFCCLEPTGLYLAWGITEDPVEVTFQDIKGNDVIVKQRAIIVGDKVRSGKNAWGKDLKQDLDALVGFLCK